MLFYLLFAILIRWKHIGWVSISAWTFASLVAAIATDIGGVQLTFPLSFFFSIYNILFCLGLVAGWVCRVYTYKFESIRFQLFVFGNFLFLTTGGIENYLTGMTDTTIALFGISAFMILMSAGDRRIEAIFSGKKILQLIGSAAYSIYLVHFVIASALGKMLSHLNLTHILPNTLGWLLIITLSTVVGIIVFQYIESPLMDISKRMVSRGKSTQPISSSN